MGNGTKNRTALVVGAGIVGFKVAQALVQDDFSVDIIYDTLLLNTVSNVAVGYIELVLVGQNLMILDRFCRSYLTWKAEIAKAFDLGSIRRARTMSKNLGIEVSVWVALEVKGFVDGFRMLEGHELPSAYTNGSGWEYETVVVQPDCYLHRLGLQLLDYNYVTLEKEHISKLSDLYDRVDVVVNATSVYSHNLFPNHEFFGKVGLLLHYKAIAGLDECRADWTDNQIAYVFPQESRIVVGGTAILVDSANPRDWSYVASENDWVSMQRRAEELELRLLGRTPVARLQGMRPYGRLMRVEQDVLEDGTLIIHAVGMGGMGWTLAPAVADDVRQLVARSFDLDHGRGDGRAITL